jgi:hypothetical protein
VLDDERAGVYGQRVRESAIAIAAHGLDRFVGEIGGRAPRGGPGLGGNRPPS